MNSLFAGIILFGSFAMRTPNIEEIKNDDYEISIGTKNNYFYINQQWERELGINYIDKEAYITWEPSIFYIKPYYIDKTSKKINYAQLDIRLKYKFLSLGTTLRSKKNAPAYFLISAGLKRNATFNKIEFDLIFDYYYSREGADYKSIFKGKFPLSKKLSLYSIFDYTFINEIEFYKFKAGFEFIL